ncbi:MAG: adenylate/guanylate cyclase domain-containing protein [Desulfobacterales bacterium]|jgi:adenylate cyclase
MAEEGFKRKLTAILSADAVGYSRLMAENENSTVKTLATYREVIASLIKQHRGRIVDSPGDNILAEFSSVVDAVQCAVAMQNEIQTQNAELPDKRRMEFRIGVNLGDVIDEEDRIYGDGVNIAARLEAMADPGGICVSKTAFDQIETKLPLGYEYLGEQSVKNIPKPIGAYRVLMKPDVAGKVIGEKRFLGRYSRRTAMAAIIILLVVAVGLVSWNIYLQRSKKVEPASVEKMAFPLPDKPSIAVLPFDNLSGDPEQEYFSDGFTEDLITTLSKIPDLFIISRQSTFTYKNKPVKVNKVAEDLGVRYVLEGSIQKSGDELRVTAQLIDAVKGHYLWSERYDRKLKNLFELKEDIILKVANELLIGLVTGEFLRQIVSYTDDPKPWQTNNLEAWETFWVAAKFGRHRTKENNARARDLYTKAHQLDPNWYVPLIAIGWTHRHDARHGWSESRDKSFDLATEYANRVLAINDESASALRILGSVHLMKREFEKANIYYEKALSLTPDNPDMQAGRGFVLNYLGEPQEAIMHFKLAMRHSPFYPAWYLHHLGLSYHLTGQYEEAIEALKKAIERTPDSLYPHVRMTAVYSDLGREQEARAEAAEVLRIKPDFSVENYARANPFKDNAIVEHRKGLLRKAGLK